MVLEKPLTQEQYVHVSIDLQSSLSSRSASRHLHRNHNPDKSNNFNNSNYICSDMNLKKQRVTMYISCPCSVSYGHYMALVLELHCFITHCSLKLNLQFCTQHVCKICDSETLLQILDQIFAELAPLFFQVTVTCTQGGSIVSTTPKVHEPASKSVNG